MVMDGDGWFTLDKKVGAIGIIGEIKFITFMKNKLKILYNIESYYAIDKRHDPRIISLRIRKKTDILTLYNLMYFDTDLFLTRKNNKMYEFLIDNNLIENNNNGLL